MRAFTVIGLASVLAVASPTIVAADEVVLDLPSYQLQEGFGDWWRAAAEEFERRTPGVRINLIDVPFSDHHSQLTTRFIAGNPPDLAHISARFYYNFADEGFLEPLDERLAAIGWKEDDFIPGQKDMRRNGQTYGQLLLGYSYGLFYNQAMLDEAGITVPGNLDELLDAVEALTLDRDGDGRPDQFGMVWPTAHTTAAYVYLTYMITGMGKDWVDADGRLIDVEDLRVALRNIDRLLKAGATPPGLDTNPARQLFWQGNAAMYIDGSWAVAYRNDAAESVKASAVVAPLPLANQAAGPSNVLAVPADLPDDRKDLAFAFLAMISSPEWQAKYAEISGNPPARLGAITAEAYEAWPEIRIFEEAAAASTGSFMPRGLEGSFNEINAVVVEAVTGMISDQLTADEAADQIHASLAAAYF